MLRGGERQSLDFARDTELVERASRCSISDPLAGARGYNGEPFPRSSQSKQSRFSFQFFSFVSAFICGICGKMDW